MVAEKSPGTDDLPDEFYKGFWEDIGEIIPNALKFSYVIGNLTSPNAIFIAISKKDSDPSLIKK